MFDTYEQWKLINQEILNIIYEIINNLKFKKKDLKQVKRLRKRLLNLDKKMPSFIENKKSYLNLIRWYYFERRNFKNPFKLLKEVIIFLIGIIKTYDKNKKFDEKIEILKNIEFDIMEKNTNVFSKLPQETLDFIINKLSFTDARHVFNSCSFFRFYPNRKKILYEKLHADLEMKCGDYHNIMRLNNEYYAWGSNQNGQLGEKINIEYSLAPIKIEEDNICDFYVGSEYTILRKYNKKLIIYGPEKKIKSEIDEKSLGIDEADTIAKIVIGISAIFILTKKNECFVQGINTSGQLGFGEEKIIKQFKKINLKNIKNIAIGETHTLFITKNHEVFVSGTNMYGQLGFENTNKVNIPKFLNLSSLNLKGEVHIAAGWNHSIIWTEDQIYIWGYNAYGQLGLGDFENRERPTKLMLTSLIHSEEKIRFLIAKSNLTFFITDKGNVFGWGQNGYGQLGLGHTEKINFPTKINLSQFGLDANDKIVEIKLGVFHTVFISESKRHFMVGDNSQYQLGFENVELSCQIRECNFEFYKKYKKNKKIQTYFESNEEEKSQNSCGLISSAM